MSAWVYNGEELRDEQTVGYVGFVYQIVLPNGMRYLGKKSFTRATYKQVKGRRKKGRKASNWRDYWGSNTRLLTDLKDVDPTGCRREVLRLCKSKGEMSYYEAKNQFAYDVLLSGIFYNDWISVRVSRKHLLKK